MLNIDTNPVVLNQLAKLLKSKYEIIKMDCQKLENSIKSLCSHLDYHTYLHLKDIMCNISSPIYELLIGILDLISNIEEYAYAVSEIHNAAEGNMSKKLLEHNLINHTTFTNYIVTQQSYQEYTINGKSAQVFDHPIDTGNFLVAEQGINDLNKQGTCSLVSCTNIMQMAGVKVSENEIVNYASKNNLCDSTGGTDSRFTEVSSILHHYGVETKTSFQETPETLAKIIENGHGVMISVDSGVLWNTPSMRFFSNVDHAVTVTSVARDPQSNKVIGFYICDTGRGYAQDSSRFVDIELMKKAHFNSKGHGIIYTQNIIR